MYLPDRAAAHRQPWIYRAQTTDIHTLFGITIHPYTQLKFVEKGRVCRRTHDFDSTDRALALAGMYYLWSERTVFLNNVGGDDLPTLTKLAGVRNADPSLFAVRARGRRGEGVFFSVLKNVS